MRSTHALPEPMPSAGRQRPWCLRALSLLLVTSLGCSSTLTTIALRDAMLQIAELGRGSDADEAQTAENDPADEEDPAELLSLEEALESAITRLAAVGRLDAAARQMLLETLESTSQQDWPVVIESFAVSLEEQAADEAAREQIAQQLAAGIDAAEETETADDTETTHDTTAALAEQPSDEAVGDATDDAGGEPALAVASTAESEASLSDPAVSDLSGTVAEGDSPHSTGSESSDLPSRLAAETPPADAVIQATLPGEPSVDVPGAMTAEPSTADTSLTATAIAVQQAAAQTEPTTQEPDLVERVTTAIRELPVADEPVASPEETMQALEAALAEARRRAPLRIGNPCFAWRVLGWGDVDCCEAACFVPGQSVIVYFEVDNLTTEAGPDGHATRLDTELALVNASGHCLHRWTFEPIVEQRTMPRRDYFARYILTMPDSIQPGPLRLEMTVHDLTGHKSADVALPLEVTTAPARPVEQVAGEASLVR
jgi:hypothetical protein